MNESQNETNASQSQTETSETRATKKHNKLIIIVVIIVLTIGLLKLCSSNDVENSTGGIENSTGGIENSTGGIENTNDLDEKIIDVDCSELAAGSCELGELIEEIFSYLRNLNNYDFLKKKYGDLDNIEFDYNDPNYDIYGVSILSWAAYLKDFNCFESLIYDGANINKVNADGNQAIHQTLWHTSDFVDVETDYCLLKSSIDAGADINATTTSGDTPLSYAMSYMYYDDNYRIAKSLLKMGANAKIGHPLAYAVRKPNMNMIKTLIKAGADVNAGGGKETTPLNATVMSKFINRDNYRDYVDTVKVLIDAGADSGRWYQGMTPLCNAIMIYGSKIEFGKEFAYAFMSSLLSEGGLGVSVNKGCAFHSPLSTAVTMHYNKTVKLLLAFGADPNRKNEVGKTALDMAIEYKHFDTYRILLDAQ